MKITKEFRIDAAHQLKGKQYGKCNNLHGHCWKLQVTIEGKVNEDGFILNFIVLKEIVNARIIEKFDHHYLNDYFDIPTAEIMATWIFKTLFNELPEDVNLHEIKLWETETSFATYDINDFKNDK
jgi:6-pyruvoyltetrahydropterin/6-carboxytetrahydropterin synthase